MTDLDHHLADRLRARRCALGLSLQELAQVGGLDLEQVHCFETGTRQLPAASLWRLARALDVEPNYFFQGLDAPRATAH